MNGRLAFCAMVLMLAAAPPLMAKPEPAQPKPAQSKQTQSKPAQSKPTKPEPANPKIETTHVVMPGETLGGIAGRTGVSRVLIIEANALEAPFELKAGQKLVIPRRRGHTVKPGETSFSIALDYGVPWSAIAAANGIDAKAPAKAGQVLTIPTLVAARPAGISAKPAASARPASTAAPVAKPAPAATAPLRPLPAAQAPTPAAVKLPADTPAPRMIWPVRGAIVRGFAARDASGSNAYHDGIDIGASKADPVRAAAEGKVIFAGQGPKEYGLTVIVYHSGRWTTTYAALDKISVKDGDKVRKGQQLGLAGTTGLAKTPQVHFEVRRNRIARDPAEFLPILPGQAAPGQAASAQSPPAQTM